jgi:hypothetical protein
MDPDDIVPGVRIRRPTGQENYIYRHAPPGVPQPRGVAADRIIGRDFLIGLGSWVIRPENPAGLLPGELGRNSAGHVAYRVDEHEGAGEMGGMMDMRTAATASRPPAPPQGFDVPGPSGARRIH